jgi:hypothetical protein
MAEEHRRPARGRKRRADHQRPTRGLQRRRPRRGARARHRAGQRVCTRAAWASRAAVDQRPGRPSVPARRASRRARRRARAATHRRSQADRPSPASSSRRLAIALAEDRPRRSAHSHARVWGHHRDRARQLTSCPLDCRSFIDRPPQKHSTATGSSCSQASKAAHREAAPTPTRTSLASAFSLPLAEGRPCPRPSPHSAELHTHQRAGEPLRGSRSGPRSRTDAGTAGGPGSCQSCFPCPAPRPVQLLVAEDRGEET